MEKNNPSQKQKAVAAALVALSLITVISILLYQNKDDVADPGNSLLSKGKSASKKGIKQSSILKERFNDLVDQVEGRIKKAVA